MNERATIPIVEVYRGVGIHDQQPRERIDGIVKPEIDRVYEVSDVNELLAFARSIQHSPEARLFAGAKIEAEWELAAQERRIRPAVDLDHVRAVVGALDSVYWRDPREYCSMLCVRSPPGMPGAIKREVLLPDKIYKSRTGALGAVKREVPIEGK